MGAKKGTGQKSFFEKKVEVILLFNILSKKQIVAPFPTHAMP